MSSALVQLDTARTWSPLRRAWANRAKARPGSIDRLAELLLRQNDEVVSSAPGTTR
jgi:hypothetical protein